MAKSSLSHWNQQASLHRAATIPRYSMAFNEYLRPISQVEKKEVVQTTTLLLDFEDAPQTKVDVLTQVETKQKTQTTTETQTMTRKRIKLQPTSIFDHFPRYKHQGLTMCFSDGRAYTKSVVHPEELMTRAKTAQNVSTMQNPTSLKAIDYMFKV